MDNDFGGLDSYEVTEQKIPDNSDIDEYTPNAQKSSGAKQLSCLGHPVSNRRAVVAIIVLFIWIFHYLAFGDKLSETAFGCFIGASSGIGTLVLHFAIMLGGKE